MVACICNPSRQERVQGQPELLKKTLYYNTQKSNPTGLGQHSRLISASVVLGLQAYTIMPSMELIKQWYCYSKPIICANKGQCLISE